MGLSVRWIVRLFAASAFCASAALATTPPPGFVLQETISVPVNGSSISSSTSLASGVTYQLRTTGTFTISAPPCPLADAEFARFEVNNTCALPGTPQDFVGAYDIGVGINSPISSNSKGITWSATFATTHQYTVPFVGAGGAISVNYHDVDYSDNSGSLTLEIFAPAAPAVSTAVPTLNEVGILALVLGIVVLTARRYREHKT